MPVPTWITTPLNAGPILANTYNYTISSLSASTVYEYCAYMVVSGTPYYGNILTGTTLPIPTSLATVNTSGITSIATTGATGGGFVISGGGATVIARGLAYGLSINPTIAGTHTIDGSGIGSFSSLISGLTQSTTYNVRAYATNSVGTAYGNQVSFVTATPPPLTIFVEACTDILNYCIGGAYSLVCCNGIVYSVKIINTPTNNYNSCTWTNVPAGCYYVDYNDVELWCGSTQQSISGINWSDNTHPSVAYACCTDCFSTDNSVSGCIY